MIDENSTFGGFLTEIGEAKQSNANALEIPWKLTHMLLGDANGTDPVPQHDQTQLINQRYRAALNQLLVDPDNPAILIAELVLPPNVGGWWIRELALEDEDGDFVAVANCAPSYKPLLAQGSGRNQVVRMHLILSNTANVQLKIDPSVVLATRKYVDDQRAEHEQNRAHPLATTTERGMVEKATTVEAKAGAADKFPDALAMRAAIDDGMAFQNVAVFDAAGTTSWPVPQELQDGRRKAYVTVIGGGGSGARGSGYSTNVAGGGAEGGWTHDLIDLSGIQSVDITVGARGEPVSADGDGNPGGTSSFGSYLSATGGKGGLHSANSPSEPGVGTGGSINIRGAHGGHSVQTAVGGAVGGTGGGAHGGSGGTTGRTAGGPGAGGGGAIATDRDSGAGHNGQVIVRW